MGRSIWLGFAEVCNSLDLLCERIGLYRYGGFCCLRDQRHTTGSGIIFFKSLLTRPQGYQRVVEKSTKIFYIIKLLSSCAKIEPKLSKLGKTIKIEKRIVKNSCFLTVLFNLGSIFVIQTIKILLKGFVWMFWHPRDSMGCVHSEDIIVFVFAFDISKPL